MIFIVILIMIYVYPMGLLVISSLLGERECGNWHSVFIWIVGFVACSFITVNIMLMIDIINLLI